MTCSHQAKLQSNKREIFRKIIKLCRFYLEEKLSTFYVKIHSFLNVFHGFWLIQIHIFFCWLVILPNQSLILLLYCMTFLWLTCHINICQRKLENPNWFGVHGRVLVATVMRAFKVYWRLSKNNFSGWSPVLKGILFFFWLALIAHASQAQLWTLHFPKPFPFSFFYGDFCAP